MIVGGPADSSVIISRCKDDNSVNSSREDDFPTRLSSASLLSFGTSILSLLLLWILSGGPSDNREGDRGSVQPWNRIKLYHNGNASLQ